MGRSQRSLNSKRLISELGQLGSRAGRRRLPLYPSKQTSGGRAEMSVQGQKATSVVAHFLSATDELSRLARQVQKPVRIIDFNAGAFERNLGKQAGNTARGKDRISHGGSR